MSRDRAELQSILRRSPGPILVSRAISPSLRTVIAAAARDDLVVRPTVGGATVWGDAADAAVVVEYPNWFGRPETIPSSPMVVVVQHPGTAPRSHCRHRFVCDDTDPGSGDAVRPYTVPSANERSDYTNATRAARRLALLARQVPGFQLAHGKPRSPWFVAMFPVEAHRVTSALAALQDIAAEPVGPKFPDLPGGVRIRVGARASEGSLRAWVGVADEVVRTERFQP